MKKILFRLSDDDYRKLRWTADKLGLNVSECLRSLIPDVQVPQARIIKESNVSFAKLDDLVPIAKLSKKDKRRLHRHLNELFERRWAVTLAREIKQQVLDKEAEYLTVGTYKRLARWLWPYRWTEREKFVKLRAQKISRLLFGRDIPRTD